MPQFVVVAALVAIQALTSAFTFLGRGRDGADDVWATVLWRNWRPFRNEISVPRDTYLIQATIATVSDRIVGPGRASLLVSIVVANVIGLGLVLFVLFKVVRRLERDRTRRLWIVALTGLTYILLSEAWLDVTARLNFRSLEIGLILAVGYVIVSDAESSGSRQTQLFAAGVAAVACFNDAMVVYVGLLPALALLVLRWMFERTSPAEHRAIATLSLGFAGWVLLTWLFAIAGMKVSDYAPPVVIQIADFPERAARTIDFAATLLGAPLSGVRLDESDGLLKVVRVGITVLVIVAAYVNRRRIPRAALGPLVMCAVIAVGTLAAATFAEIGAFDGQNSRYITPVVGPFAVLVLVTLAAARQRARVVLSAAMLMAAVLGAAIVVPRAADSLRDEVPQTWLTSSKEVFDELEARGLEFGYAPYFTGIPIEYWGGDDIVVTTSTCRTGAFGPGDFSESQVFDETVEQSFYIQPVNPGFDHCDTDVLDRQFGPPLSTEQITIPEFGDFAELEIRVYPGNIGRAATDE